MSPIRDASETAWTDGPRPPSPAPPTLPTSSHLVNPCPACRMRNGSAESVAARLVCHSRLAVGRAETVATVATVVARRGMQIVACS